VFGRVFGPGDDRVAVLSYDGWIRYFNRDPRAIGSIVRLGGHPYQIIGVTPEGFNGTSPDTSPALRAPYQHLPDFSERNFLEIIARLKPAVPLEQAREEVTAFWKTLPEAVQGAIFDSRIELRSIERGSSYLREQFRTALLLVTGGTGLLLLMVCSNVSGLLLARHTARAKETAVRLALGASRMRIIRQCLSESFLLTGIGGTAGLGLAYAGIPLLVRWMPQLPLNSWDLRTFAVHIRPDLRIIAFSIISCGLTLILSAFAPAWRASGTDPYTALKGTMSDIRHRRLQTFLGSLQVAICTVLVIAAGLMIRTLSNLHAIDPGFESEHVATFSIDPQVGNYNGEQTWLFQQRLLRESRSMPDVEAAGIAGMPLMRGIGTITATSVGGQRGQLINVNFVTTGYFDAMKMPILAGRQFKESDKPDATPMPVIVNEAFARRFFAGRSAIGEHFGSGPGQREIVGVVSDAHYRSLREIPPPIVYMSNFGPKAPALPFVLHIRTRGSPEGIIEPIRKLLQSIDPRIPIFQASTLAAEMERSLWRERLIAALSSAFGVFALIISAIGLYGTLAYFVAQHRREIGLRLALGARAAHVSWMVSSRIGPMMIAGVIAGVGLYLAAGAWIRSLLFGVAFADPISIVAAVVLLLAAAAGAAGIPVVRALHVDPVSTLKQE